MLPHDPDIKDSCLDDLVITLVKHPQFCGNFNQYQYHLEFIHEFWNGLDLHTDKWLNCIVNTAVVLAPVLYLCEENWLVSMFVN